MKKHAIIIWVLGLILVVAVGITENVQYKSAYKKGLEYQHELDTDSLAAIYKQDSLEHSLELYHAYKVGQNQGLDAASQKIINPAFNITERLRIDDSLFRITLPVKSW